MQQIQAKTLPELVKALQDGGSDVISIHYMIEIDPQQCTDEHYTLQYHESQTIDYHVIAQERYNSMLYRVIGTKTGRSITVKRINHVSCGEL